MANYTKNLTLLTILIAATSLVTGLSEAAGTTRNTRNNVHQACSVTRYRTLCVRSLSPFSGVAGTSPSRWARAGVSVSIAEAKGALRDLARLRRYNPMRGRNRMALSDCVECLGDAVDELHRSLGVLRRLQRRGFAEQMGDLLTWLSAALTDAETCSDGFADQKGRRARFVRRRVGRASGVISNALALANRLASTGGFY